MDLIRVKPYAKEAVLHTEGPLLVLAGARLRENQSPDTSCRVAH